MRTLDPGTERLTRRARLPDDSREVFTFVGLWGFLLGVGEADHGIGAERSLVGLVLGVALVALESLDADADLLESGEEFADAVVVVDPALESLGLVFVGSVVGVGAVVGRPPAGRWLGW